MTTTLAKQLLGYIESRYPDTRIVDLNFLARGFESEIYTFCFQTPENLQKNYILRLFHGDDVTEKLSREARGLRLLQKAGFPVPVLLLQETDPKILGKPFEIIEKLEGQVLWPLLESSESDQTEQLLTRSGLLLARLHKLDWRLLFEIPDEHQDNPTLSLDETISKYRSLYTNHNLKGFIHIVEWLNAHKQEISVRPVIVHQDFHANNIFVCTNDQLFVIDWTQFDISDYRIDLCWTMMIMGDFGKVEWGEHILKTYASNIKKPIEHLDYFNVIVYMKLLASIVISFYSNHKVQRFEMPKEQLLIFERLSQRLRNITSLTIPELDILSDRNQ
jgi:aminoglycoside phosphotransferase (APT) family kinase protein